MADLMSPDREFGVDLGTGVTVGPGTLIYVDSNAKGQISGLAGPVHAYSLTSGAGTKTAGIATRVLGKRNGILKVPNASYTKGITLYANANGVIAGSGAGLAIKVGFALDSEVAFIDLDLESI